jgi:5-methylthioadenosine/S-adenosylhomocysteine deaminase
VAFFPLHDLKRQLVHCEDGQSLRMSFVNGELVFDHGRLTMVDERAVKAEIREHLGRVKTQLSQGAHEAAQLEPYYRAMLARSLQHPVKMRRHLYGD